jgi:hypothetical protein
MKKKCTSARCCDPSGNALYGGFFGIAVAALHHVQHAFTSQIPENIPAHVLGEFAVAACGGAIMFAVASAICNRLKGNA